MDANESKPSGPWTVSVTELKEKCRELLGEGTPYGQEIIVTRRGKKVARLYVHPVPQHDRILEYGGDRDRMTILGDIVAPALDCPEDLEADFPRAANL